MKTISFAFFILTLVLGGFSQVPIDSIAQQPKIYQLGEVIITETIDKEMIGAKDMQKINARDVCSALISMPSIMLNKAGSRNESTVNIRGFDIRSIPVFLDGIPIYVPYDGYVDLARFTTYDISKIDVSKGFSSMTYGANTIGGAINLVSIKPSRKIEVDAKIGVMSGNGYDTKLNIGSNLGKVYFQTGFSLLNREYTLLSSSFDTLSLETNYKRDNSHRKDIKSSLKIGFTPNKTDEYSINYIYSHGSKGNPVYLGTDENTRLRYWKWPYWDKQSLYYISNTAIGTKLFLKVRMYYDQFKNRLDSFDDDSYTTQEKRYAFSSFYDDYTLGGNIVLSSKWRQNNLLKFSAHIKNDNHSSHNKDEPISHFADNTYSYGLENVYKANHKTTLITGISYNLRQSLRADNYNSDENTIGSHPPNKNDILNAQLSAYHKLSNSVNINFNVAYKSRFATMKNRYSYRIGRAIPNPELESEMAINFELASSIKIKDKLSLRPELFYSRLNNTIQEVSNVQDDLSQMQNTGEAVFMGADLSIIYTPIDDIKIYATYSYIERNNLSNPDILFTNLPTHKIFASTEYNITENFFVNLFGIYNSKRFNESDGSRVSSEFFILNTQTSYRFTKHLTSKIGINNIFDKNYTIDEGYPEEGRNFYFSLYFNL